MTFSRWYPSVCLYRDGRWNIGQYVRCCHGSGEYARYNVALQIDSTYSIAHPGQLLNEKEHYGLLPEGVGDTVYVDVVNEHCFAVGGVKYHPEFSSGRKPYFIRALNATDFSFIAGTRFIRDRTCRGNLTIEICYREGVRNVWAGFVVRSALSLVKQYEKWLGKFPRSNLTVVAGESSAGQCGPSQFVVIPADIKDTSLLYTVLAIELAHCWLSPVLPDSTGAGQWFDEGCAYYVAARALYDSFGAEGYRKLREHRKFVSRRLNENEWSREFATRVFHQIPSQIHALRFVVGDQTVSKALREYTRRFSHEFPYARDFLDVVKELMDEGTHINLNDWTSAGSVLDFGLSSMKAERAETGYDVSYEVENLGSMVMPVEIGYVISVTDTIYDTLQYNRLPGPGRCCVFRKTILRRPEVIALDPNHYLPDVDRSNNYSFTLPVRFKYRSPEAAFPPLDDPR